MFNFAHFLIYRYEEKIFFMFSGVCVFINFV